MFGLITDAVCGIFRPQGTLIRTTTDIDLCFLGKAAFHHCRFVRSVILTYSCVFTPAGGATVCVSIANGQLLATIRCHGYAYYAYVDAV